MEMIIVYWSGTGNTKKIAEMIASDTNAAIYSVDAIDVNSVCNFDKIILGCPAMGLEELEDMEFKPFYEELIKKLDNQVVYLFGSYDWGDGQWMRDWQDDVINNKIALGCEGLIVNKDSSIPNDDYDKFITSILN